MASASSVGITAGVPIDVHMASGNFAGCAVASETNSGAPAAGAVVDADTVSTSNLRSKACTPTAEWGHNT